MRPLNPLQDALLSYIERTDPSHRVVHVDTVNETIRFAAPIRSHQLPKYEKEGFVRAYLIVKLVLELGYPQDCIEIETDITVRVGRTKRSKGKDRGRNDVAVYKRSGTNETLFLGIECKWPDDYEAGKKDLDGQLWGITKAAVIEQRVGKSVRYLSLFTCELSDSGLRDQAIVIDFGIHPTHLSWIRAGAPAALVIPGHYGDAPLVRYGNVGEPRNGLAPLDRSYGPNDFRKLRTLLHNRLWAGASSDDNAIFYQLVKLFLTKIYDEQTTEPEQPYRFQIQTTQAGEQSVSDVAKGLEQLYQEAARELLNYDDEKLANEPFKSSGITDDKVMVATRELQGISLTNNLSTEAGFDVLGSFFEGILSNQDFFKQSKGQFFTHQTLVRFMLAMTDIGGLAVAKVKASPKPALPYIIDPSCGSGTFLIEAMKWVTATVTAKQLDQASGLALAPRAEDFYKKQFLVPERPNKWAEDYLYGIETRPDLALAAKVNMILHGDGNMNIFVEDALHRLSHPAYSRRWANMNEGVLCVETTDEERGNGHGAKVKTRVAYQGVPVNAQFDVVVTNPPFALDVEGLPSRPSHDTTFLYSDRGNSENLFLERHYQLLREGGRLAVVLPESVFDTTDNRYIRLFLYKYFWIDAVVSLPVEAFQPFTTIKTSLLFATKKSLAEVATFEEFWRLAAAEYGRLRGTPIIQSIIQNERLMSAGHGLRALCAALGLEIPEGGALLNSTLLTSALRTAIERGLTTWQQGSASEVKRAERGRQVFDDATAFVNRDPFGGSDEGAVDALRRFLRRLYPAGCSDIAEVCEKAYDELLSIADLDWPDYNQSDRYCNAWWCLSEVLEQTTQQRNIFFADAREIGYKRTKRGEFPRPNDLFQVVEKAGSGFPTPVPDAPETILDHYVAFVASGRTQAPESQSVFIAPGSVVADTFSLGLRVSLVRFVQTQFNHIDWSKSVPFRQYIESSTSGNYVAKSNYSAEETDLAYLSVNNFTGEEPDLRNVVYLKPSTPAGDLGVEIRDGDVVITRSGTIGHTHVVRVPPDETRTLYASHHLFIVRLTPEARRSKLLPYFLGSTFVKDFLYNFSQGKSQKELTNWSVRNLPVPAHDFGSTEFGSLRKLERQLQELKQTVAATEMTISELVASSIRGS